MPTFFQDLPSRAGARNPALSSSSSIKGEYPSPVEFFDMQTQRFPSDRISSMERSPEDPAPSSTVYPQHSHYGELGYGSVGYGSGYGGGGGVAEMEYGRVVQHRMHQPLYGMWIPYASCYPVYRCTMYSTGVIIFEPPTYI